MIMSMFMTRRILGKWYPNDALEIVLLWKLIDKYKKDYYERPHIERPTNSRGVNRREATFMETQNLHTDCVLFLLLLLPPSTFSDFSCRRLSTNEENSVVQAARQTPEASMLLNWWKSQKQEFHGGKTKFRIHWNWIARVTCCASHADGTSWSDMWTFSWSDMCKSDDCRLSIEQI